MNPELLLSPSGQPVDDAVLAELRRVLGDARTLGDVVGHPFHGNQWTEGITVRDVGHEAGSDAVSSITRPGHFYRGMTETEFQATVGAGRGVRSRGDFSTPGEGTSLSEDAADAESYINFGRDDPRKTGNPTYLVEVRGEAGLKRDRDGYVKAADAIPNSRITRIFEMRAENGAIVGRPLKLRGAEFNPDQPRDKDGQWADGGTSAEPDPDHETLRRYTQTGGTYREVNAGLRGGKDMASHPTVVALDKAFAQHGEPAPAVVYRGIAGYEHTELNLEEGKTFTDPGFVSTASVKSDAVKFATHGSMKLEGEQVGIIFKINTGKVAVLNMGRYSRYGESELLLNRGTTFKVTSIKEGYPGEALTVVTMSVVKP